MKSKVYSESDRKHEIYFTPEDFSSIYKQNDSFISKKQVTPYGQLLFAKACFFKSKYKQCLKVLQDIRPDLSTKILYERQALIIKAMYLIDQADNQRLEAQAQLYFKFKNKCPGRSLTPFHDANIKDLIMVAKMYKKKSKIASKQEKESLRL